VIIIEEVDLPVNWNPRLITQMAAEMAIITLLLSQMAKLESSISTYFEEESRLMPVEAMET
jgi:hypothetical protein